MEKRSYTSTVKNYVRLNWFKLALLGLLVFVFLRKDLSFQFNLNSPSDLEEILPSGSDHLPVKTAKEKEEILTQKEENQNPSGQSQTYLSSVELPFFGNNTTAPKKSVELAEVDQLTRQAYVKRFGHLAVSESKKYNIPASIILANGILHSIYGQRSLTRQGNNHFGIPCTPQWQGESGTYNDACYRHYENAWASFRDHSLFLTSGKFAPLRQLSTGDYKAWARGLEKYGYSDLYKDLADRLIKLIESEELFGYDMR